MHFAIHTTCKSLITMSRRCGRGASLFRRWRSWKRNRPRMTAETSTPDG